MSPAHRQAVAVIPLARKRALPPLAPVIPMSVSQADFRKALSSFATGVTVVTVDSGQGVHGMTANAFTSVSLNPRLVLVCVDRRARTHAHLHARKRFGVNVLSEKQRALSEHFARASRHDHETGIPGARFDRTKHGTPVLHGALAYLECRLHTVQDAGDHTIFIAEVEDIVMRHGKPLLYFQSEYRSLGKAVQARLAPRSAKRAQAGSARKSVRSTKSAFGR